MVNYFHIVVVPVCIGEQKFQSIRFMSVVGNDYINIPFALWHCDWNES